MDDFQSAEEVSIDGYHWYFIRYSKRLEKLLKLLIHFRPFDWPKTACLIVKTWHASQKYSHSVEMNDFTFSSLEMDKKYSHR